MEWINARMKLPDSDTTVLIACPDEDEPVWMGYHDGEEWAAVDGSLPIRVTHWANFPEPPPCCNPRPRRRNKRKALAARGRLADHPT